MIATFLREQKRYTLQELCGLLDCKEKEGVGLLRKLKEYGILKVVKDSPRQRSLSDLVDEDVEVADIEVRGKAYLYVLTFVGVIVVAGRVLKCYPKYLLHNEAPLKELRQVLKVLHKYGSREQLIRSFDDSGAGRAFNLLAVLLYLLNDYYENGSYDNSVEVIESNGTGEILWEKTVNETFPLLIHQRPYYIDLLTKRRVSNDYDYFKRLHECILTKASQELQAADLMELFEITEVALSEEELADFGDEEYILYRLERELNVQFNTRKQLVLKALYVYVAHSRSINDTEALTLLGTNSFNLVWERVCAEIMDNKLQTALGSLQLPVPLNSNNSNKYDGTQKLIDLIEKPLWTAPDQRAKDTLIPDLISIHNEQFIIFDAKYYNAKLEPGKPPEAQPGIDSVMKQYLYQLAYKDFIKDHKLTQIKNCFLLPTEEENVIDKGEVRMDMLSNLGLQNIEVRLLPASMAYDHYLSGRKMDISQLGL